MWFHFSPNKWLWSSENTYLKYHNRPPKNHSNRTIQVTCKVQHQDQCCSLSQMKKTNLGNEKVLFCVPERKTLWYPQSRHLLPWASKQVLIGSISFDAQDQPNILKATKLKPLTATLQQERSTCLKAQENATCGCTWVFPVSPKAE